MYIHKEGHKFLLIILILLIIINIGIKFLIPSFFIFILIISIAFYIFLLSFFRNPRRIITEINNNKIYAPADGKIVAIEETLESEFLKEKRIQLSIFMSVTNVHVNRNPVGGKIIYYKYHEGKYMAAWNPKSSLENERTTVVYQNKEGTILVRQIAGALARRIVNYVSPGEQVGQGEEMGFIKFGSRVDLFLPLDAQINVTLNQKVIGNKTIIAELD